MQVYQPTHKIRFVTAASLFDGHDAAINVMRRILQSSGAEVIHLGHNRSVGEVVEAALQEDVQGIAVSSYQGGHMEYFTYLLDLLRERGAGHVKVYGGGGGVIVPDEIAELERRGVSKIFSPEDGRQMGLQGMINLMLEQCDYPPTQLSLPELPDSPTHLARLITFLETGKPIHIPAAARPGVVVGITGTGGAGKSSLTDELVRRFLDDFLDKRVAILSVDPTKRKTGGALLGDRIRMNSIYHPRVYMRSLATRAAHQSTSEALLGAIKLCQAAGYDLVIVETAGIGQSDSAIVDLVDVSLYVMTAEYGAPSQLEKIDMLDYADLVALNKFEKRGSEDALRDVRKQIQRNRQLFQIPAEEMPVYPTIASQFHDPGTNLLYRKLIDKLNATGKVQWTSRMDEDERLPEKKALIPPHRERYLADIADTVQNYKREADRQSQLADRLQAFETVRAMLPEAGQHADDLATKLTPAHHTLLAQWNALASAYRSPEHSYTVRGKEIRVHNHTNTLSGLPIPKVAFPRFSGWGDRLRWLLLENVPGSFPFTAGVFPYKRTQEDPTRMFAGEGPPERTNKRFHFLSQGQPAARLSTAFDSVTLYGEDPDLRPDIYGKIGNSGVSICTVDDAKKLYSGFDLCAPTTSVSMTINGPAPMLLAFFMNAAIDQQVERYLQETGGLEEARDRINAWYRDRDLAPPRYEGDLPEGNNGFGLATLGLSGDQLVPEEVYQNIKQSTLQAVRGTVQADILKEDQAQNTCIFSTEFALRLMGDVQQSFVDHGVRNYYSVSVSGYHIAEAGANPITQLAFTLANGFTLAEYYLARGMKIDDFAPNFSFFFSNGIDAEYSVIGRVARRIWAIAMRDRYSANDRSQRLKYHIQTSGRSLHAQEIDFNDIRTTLQALYAIYDNCNSLHTNAFDEAITTPTENSVRRALAIQLIINRELGTAKCENVLQGSFLIEELTDLVEEAVLMEFRRLSDRGGVLGAMETMYQRGKIQDESLHYEHLKHTGELPIIGVNTFLNPHPATYDQLELIRSTENEKRQQLDHLERFHQAHAAEAPQALDRLKQVARQGGNLFEELMETVKVCSLGQITHALYEVGGQYRRNV